MTMGDLKVNLNGINLTHPLMNSGGTCKRLDEVKKFAEVDGVAAIKVGSITFPPRAGNPWNVYFYNGIYSLNSNGLPNPGWQYYKENLPAMIKLAHGADKPLFVNIAGETIQEYVDLALSSSSFLIDLLILNCSCPNVWSDAMQKRILCYDPDNLRLLLFQLKTAFTAAKIPIPQMGIKISPMEPYLLEKIVEIISFDSFNIHVVIACNTSPNGFLTHANGTPVLDKMKYGGVGGPALKPTAMGMVCQLKRLLPERIKIIAAGGVHTGQDVKDYLIAGADAVEAATAFFGTTCPIMSNGHNYGVYTEIMAQYMELMKVEL